MSTINDAKYQLVHNYPGGAVALAPLVDRTPSVLSNKVNPNVDTHHLTVDEAVTLQAITHNFDLLKAVATILNHVVIELPSVNLAESSDIEILDTWAKWKEDIGQTATAIRHALEDGNITKDELASIKMEIFEDFAREMELFARLEAMADV